MAGADFASSTPFEALAEYERRSLAHAAGAPEQVEAPGLWRGIGFRIGTRHFVSGIAEVNEILTLPPLTVVPGAKSWLLGIANVRGNLVPAVDLRDFIGDGRSPLSDASRVLMVREQGSSAEAQFAAAVGETDEKYSRFVGENVQSGDVLWGLFSMAALVRIAEFQQAAA